jgi:hypothetical protein
MNKLNMTTEDWKQYLSTRPDGDPKEYFDNILAAFKKGFIDYADAHLATQQYESENPEWQAMSGRYYTAVQMEEKRQDRSRAISYKELQRQKK